jgi:hypothetical protein
MGDPGDFHIVKVTPPLPFGSFVSKLFLFCRDVGEEKKKRRMVQEPG